MNCDTSILSSTSLPPLANHFFTSVLFCGLLNWFSRDQQNILVRHVISQHNRGKFAAKNRKVHHHSNSKKSSLSSRWRTVPHAHSKKSASLHRAARETPRLWPAKTTNWSVFLPPSLFLCTTFSDILHHISFFTGLRFRRTGSALGFSGQYVWFLVRCKCCCCPCVPFDVLNR